MQAPEISPPGSDGMVPSAADIICSVFHSVDARGVMAVLSVLFVPGDLDV